MNSQTLVGLIFVSPILIVLAIQVGLIGFLKFLAFLSTLLTSVVAIVPSIAIGAVGGVLGTLHKLWFLPDTNPILKDIVNTNSIASWCMVGVMAIAILSLTVLLIPISLLRWGCLLPHQGAEVCLD